MKHLAEINIARLKHDSDDQRVAPFMNALDKINGIAERSDGFQWRYTDVSGNATDTLVMNDPRVIVNVSTWDRVENLETFVWGTIHRQFYQRRDEWFNMLDSMHFAMWWVDPGTTPSVEEAMGRLAHLDAHGNSDHAFGWSHLPQATRWRSAQCSTVAAE
ncbi:DUF3291 domain-containing protein [Pseudophaeobacter sp.]|jgi:hypothetical protein|uniref:DUF3291 domain-containing protein n=1 Tax=Pseudophaeobacter sp. TaxID=1971739 RepID=UPI0032D9367A